MAHDTFERFVCDGCGVVQEVEHQTKPNDDWGYVYWRPFLEGRGALKSRDWELCGSCSARMWEWIRTQRKQELVQFSDELHVPQEVA